jgi:hypothetical protein
MRPLPPSAGPATTLPVESGPLRDVWPLLHLCAACNSAFATWLGAPVAAEPATEPYPPPGTLSLKGEWVEIAPLPETEEPVGASFPLQARLS